jgi:chaperonin GroES
MSVYPLNNYVLVEPLEINTNVERRATNTWCKVLEVGPGSPDIAGSQIPPKIEKDMVCYVRAHGLFPTSNRAVEENKIFLCSEFDVMGIMTDRDTTGNIENNFQPLGQLVLLEVNPEPPKSTSGLEAPDQKQLLSNNGKVLALGYGWLDRNGEPLPFQVEVGDQILFDPHRLQSITFYKDGLPQKLYLIEHSDIYAKF